MEVQTKNRWCKNKADQEKKRLWERLRVRCSEYAPDGPHPPFTVDFINEQLQSLNMENHAEDR